MEIKHIQDFGDRYKDQTIDLMRYCFMGWPREDMVKGWDNLKREEAEIIGNFDEDTLASSLRVIHHDISIYGTTAPMGGIGAVTTAANYRSGGVCRNLINYTLDYMNKEGKVFSVLAPFKYEFYEKFGYKWCYEYKEFKLPIELLRSFKSDGSYIMVTPSSRALLENLYQEFMMKYNGMCIRSKKLWDGYLKEDLFATIYKSPSGSLDGYIRYTINDKDGYFEVQEIMYRNISALKGLLQFIYKHEAQTKNVKILALTDNTLLDVLPNPRIETKVTSYMMNRIVNVERAIPYYPFVSEGHFVIHVTDSNCDWNDGLFEVVIDDTTHVAKSDSTTEADFKIDIKQLTQLILGFRTFDTLLTQERIELLNPNFEYTRFFNNKEYVNGLYDYF